MGSFIRRPSAAPNAADMPQNGTFLRRASAVTDNSNMANNSRSPELAPSAPMFPRKPSAISSEINPANVANGNANAGGGLNKGFEGGAHPASFARRAMMLGAEGPGTFVRRSMIMNPSLLSMQATVVSCFTVYVCVCVCLYIHVGL